MTERSCADVRVLAPELALDLLSGSERAAALEHLSGCAACRRSVQALLLVTDSLFLLAPEAEPPPGFESRVLARRETPPHGARRTRRRLIGAAAALVAAAVALVVVLVGGPDSDDDLLRSASFASSEGEVDGEVVLFSGESSYMLCRLVSGRLSGEQTLELVRADGVVETVGTFAVENWDRGWFTEIDVPIGDVTAVRLRDPTGKVLTAAVFQ